MGRLVFSDWQKLGKSVYETGKGVMLSLGDFHSGTTFDDEIDITGSEEELKKAMEDGFEPVFYAIPGDE